MLEDFQRRAAIELDRSGHTTAAEMMKAAVLQPKQVKPQVADLGGRTALVARVSEDNLRKLTPHQQRQVEKVIWDMWRRESVDRLP